MAPRMFHVLCAFYEQGLVTDNGNTYVHQVAQMSFVGAAVNTGLMQGLAISGPSSLRQSSGLARLDTLSGSALDEALSDPSCYRIIFI